MLPIQVARTTRSQEMFEWVFKFTVIWISIDIFIVATCWYVSKLARPLFPEWWRRVVMDDDRDLIA